MDLRRSSPTRHRTIGQLKPQDHSARRLLIILATLGVGLGVLFFAAYVAARLDSANFDNQETPQPSNTLHNRQHSRQNSQHNP